MLQYFVNHKCFNHLLLTKHNNVFLRQHNVLILIPLAKCKVINGLLVQWKSLITYNHQVM